MGRAVLTVPAAVLYAVGWTAGVVVLAVGWVAAAVRLGWAESRKAAGR